ncbi:PAT complex subunit CCDC47-like [Corticium candelabrum]|uniref:PAT complex subunit CCDC47-like n=1 Tax=Corticium candelabrum TaxID=121492 RepID=UPI002E274F4D|nr:PAT complex subunit CCDC47-like [Corticium candelabrum]
MTLLLLLLLFLIASPGVSQTNEDDDFSEFDNELEVEEEDEGNEFTTQYDETSEDESQEMESDEFMTVDDKDDHLLDEEEFEGYDTERQSSERQGKVEDLKIVQTKVAMRATWDSYVIEILMIAGLLVYAINYTIGKSKNSVLASAWYQAHKELLESNFEIVGDDGATKEASSGTLVKQTENVFTLWCSGRVCCEGMLVELKLLKRQDLMSTMSKLMKPGSDIVRLTVNFGTADIDPFVFAVLPSRVAPKLHKELQDLSYYCTDRRPGEKYGLPSSLTVLSEMSEVASSLLNSQVVQEIVKYEGIFESVHISDQYTGVVESPDTQDSSAPPIKPEKIMLFTFTIPGKGKSTTPSHMGLTLPLVKMALRLIDKVQQIRVSREAKEKAVKRRAKVEESLLKQTHAQRQEAAQQRREEKRRAEKERIMEENDPVKARKLEEREHKKAMKKSQPKMKQMKVRMS